MTASDLDPLKMVEQDIYSSETCVQLDAVSNLKIVARALGVMGAQSELLPVLEKYCFPDPEQPLVDSVAKEEVTAAIAGVLDDEFAEYIGGSLPCGQWQLPLLEKLASVEETVIRDNAVRSLCKCIKKMDPPHVSSYAHPVFTRLCSEDAFSNKISAAGMTATLYDNIPDETKKQEILDLHKKLIRDEMPMVRSEAFIQVPHLIEVGDVSFYENYGKFILKHLTQEVPGVTKVLIVKIALTFLLELTKKGMPPEQVTSRIWPWFEKVANDDSWRIRFEFAKSLPDIAEGFASFGNIPVPLVELTLKIMSDSEPHVRQSILQSLPKALKCLTLQDHSFLFMNKIIDLGNDSVAEVREHCSKYFMGIIRNTRWEREKLIDLLKIFRSDENPQVRLNLCHELGELCTLLGEPRDFILELANEWQADSKWRIRYGIVSNVAKIAEHIGQTEFAESFLKNYLLTRLTDPAYKVRASACTQINLLTKQFGIQFLQDVLLVDIIEKVFQEDRNYLHRMMVFKVAKDVSDVISETRDNVFFNNNFVPLIIQGLQDSVPNVRIACLRTCIYSSHFIKRSKQIAQIKLLLQQAIEEEEVDPDVKYYAHGSLEVYNGNYDIETVRLKWLKN